MREAQAEQSRAERKQQSSKAKTKKQFCPNSLLRQCMQDSSAKREAPPCFSWLFLCRVLIYCECASVLEGNGEMISLKCFFSLGLAIFILGGLWCGVIKSERRFAVAGARLSGYIAQCSEYARFLAATSWRQGSQYPFASAGGRDWWTRPDLGRGAGGLSCFAH